MVRGSRYYWDIDGGIRIYSEDWLVKGCWVGSRRTDVLGIFCHHFHLYANFDSQQNSQKEKPSQIVLWSYGLTSRRSQIDFKLSHYCCVRFIALSFIHV